MRVRIIDGKPFSYLTTHVPERIGVTYSEPELASQPLLALLERSGVTVDRATQEIGAVLASPEVARALGVAIGSALIALTRVVYDNRGRGVEHLHALYLPDRYAFRMDLDAPGGAGGRRWSPVMSSRAEKLSPKRHRGPDRQKENSHDVSSGQTNSRNHAPKRSQDRSRRDWRAGRACRPSSPGGERQGWSPAAADRRACLRRSGRPLGAELAIKAINDAGGVKSLGGANIEPNFGDARSTPEGGSSEVERMASENVSAIVGGFASPICLAATQSASRYDLPYIVDVGVSQIVGRDLKNTFRFAPGASIVSAHALKISQAQRCGRQAGQVGPSDP